MTTPPHILIIGAGIGGLTAAALLAKRGYRVTVLEAQLYPGGCAGTFTHQGYRFDAGATVIGGMQANGPHARLAEILNLTWPVQQHDPAWVVHLPDRSVRLSQDNRDVLAQFPRSEVFWAHQRAIADLGWALTADGLAWPPALPAELLTLAKIGLKYFPADLRLLPLIFRSAARWAGQYGLSTDPAFLRFLDAQLLISAQTTAQRANALYSATALDLPRQGVFHVAGGIGGLAETLVKSIQRDGGDVLYRQQVKSITIENGRVTGVHAQHGKRDTTTQFYPADCVVANLPPASLDELLTAEKPQAITDGWGAFVLHLGVQADSLPAELSDHHQFINTLDGALGEGESVFMSLSPTWDTSRAPAGMRAVTLSTHTRVGAWWQARAQSETAYADRKAAYAEHMLQTVARALPAFRAAIRFQMAGSPVTYHQYTGRHSGMVGGFPQESLFTARSPRTKIPNLWMVGDSIFPGQSTAGVTLGAMRVVELVRLTLHG